MSAEEKTCPYCAETIKAAAVVCKHCGRDLAGSPGAAGSPTPATIVTPKAFKWWLWVPLGLLAAFFLYGALIPEHVAKANATRRACEKMAGGIPHLQYECGRIYERMIRDGEAKGRREGCPPEHTNCSWGK